MTYFAKSVYLQSAEKLNVTNVEIDFRSNKR